MGVNGTVVQSPLEAHQKMSEKIERDKALKKNTSHALTAAQIENRRYSVFIRNLEFGGNSNEEMKDSIKEDLSNFGTITNVSVDSMRQTAIIRFRMISEAEEVYNRSQDEDEDTGQKVPLLREPNEEALFLYVIPEVSKEEMLRNQAAMNNEVYDPLNDENLTLEQVTRFIKEQNDEVKLTFKKFCEAPSNSELKQEMQTKLKEVKARLTQFIQKEKSIKMQFSIRK